MFQRSHVFNVQSVLGAEQGKIFAKQGISSAEQGIRDVAGRVHRIALRLRYRDGVVIPMVNAGTVDRYSKINFIGLFLLRQAFLSPGLYKPRR